MQKILKLDNPREFLGPIIDKCSKETAPKVRKDTTISLFKFISHIIISNHLVLIPKTPANAISTSEVGSGPNDNKTNNNNCGVSGVTGSTAGGMSFAKRRKVWGLLLKIFEMIMFDQSEIAQYSNSAPSFFFFFVIIFNYSWLIFNNYDINYRQ